VFARLADGNAQTVRAISGQATMLGRTMHGIAYDEVHDEIVVPQQFGQAILTFRGSADGPDAPIRVIQGPKTQLISPDGLSIDAARGEILVPEGNRVMVFPRMAQGDVAPVRILGGPDTRLGRVLEAMVDNVRDVLVVLSTPPEDRIAYQIAIFDRTASGNAKPKRVISGLEAYGNIALHPPSGLIFVVMPPRVGTFDAPTTDEISYVGVWSVEDEGRVPPRYRIGGPKGVLVEPRGVTVDPKNKTVIVSDKQLNAVFTFDTADMMGRPQPGRTEALDFADAVPRFFERHLRGVR
jgi:hypothetical protein